MIAVVGVCSPTGSFAAVDGCPSFLPVFGRFGTFRLIGIQTFGGCLNNGTLIEKLFVGAEDGGGDTKFIDGAELTGLTIGVGIVTGVGARLVRGPTGEVVPPPPVRPGKIREKLLSCMFCWGKLKPCA